MTKRVRIENADASNHVLEVTTHDHVGEGTIEVNKTLLAFPADQVEIDIWGNRTITIRELPLDAPVYHL